MFDLDFSEFRRIHAHLCMLGWPGKQHSKSQVGHEVLVSLCEPPGGYLLKPSLKKYLSLNAPFSVAVHFLLLTGQLCCLPHSSIPSPCSKFMPAIRFCVKYCSNLLCVFWIRIFSGLLLHADDGFSMKAARLITLPSWMSQKQVCYLQDTISCFAALAGLNTSAPFWQLEWAVKYLMW